MANVSNSDDISIGDFYSWKFPYIQDNSQEALAEVERISASRIHLVVNIPFFGYVLQQFGLIPVNDIRVPTISADYSNFYFNRNFIERKKSDELRSMLLHVVIHHMFFHYDRRENRAKEIWKLACEIATDLTLYTIGSDNPSLKIQKPNIEAIQMFKGKTSEEIYEILISDLERRTNDSNVESSLQRLSSQDETSGSDDSQTEEGESADSLDKIQNALSTMKSQLGGDEECGYFDGMGRSNDSLDLLMADLLRDRMEGLVRDNYVKHKGVGVLPGSLKDWIQNLMEPEIPWQVLLQRYIQHVLMVDWRWFPPNKRLLHYGFFVPSADKEYMDVVVAVDTSGSIGTEELTIFVSEIFGIMSKMTRMRLTLIDCDMNIRNVSVYEDGESVDGSMLPWEGREFQGGGGTSFEPVFDYINEEMSEKPNVLIYFTDGYGSYPDPPPGTYDVIWIMTTDYTPPFGNVIRHSSSSNRM